MKYDFGLIVIGGGSAGFAAAGRAVAQGARVAIVEADKLGGDCPNRACVPTKLLIQSAAILSTVENAGLFGVNAENVSFDLNKIQARKEWIVNQLTGGRLQRVLDQRGISLYKGRAVFRSDHELEIDGMKVTAADFIIAVGSQPFVPPIKGLEKTGYITSSEAVNIRELPESIVIVGGGPVGVEFAQIFSRFGVAVTLVEARDRLLGREDAEISELLKTYIGDQGITVVTDAEISSVGRKSGQKVIDFADGDHVFADEIMIAAGRIPAIDGLNLEAAGVAYERRGIVVDDFLRTSRDNIWACGDVTGKQQFTHVATYQGDLAGYNATSDQPDTADYTIVPRVVFSDPEVAAVGPDESEAAADLPILVGRMPYRYLGKSIIIGESRGLIKLVAGRDDRRILGGRIIGSQAGELIHEIAVAIKEGTTVDTLAEVMHAYPTLSEGVESAAADAVMAEGVAFEEKAA